MIAILIMGWGIVKLFVLLQDIAYSKTRKGVRIDGQRGKADLEVGLGIVVADVSY